MDELQPYLKRFAHRIRWRSGWLLAQRSLWFVAATSLLIQVLGRLAPIEQLQLWTALPVVLWLLMVPGFTLIRPLSAIQVARQVDLELDLKQRLSTALALSDIRTETNKNFPDYLLTAQRRDALLYANQIQTARDFPISFLRRPSLTAAILVLCIVVLVFFPNPMDAVIAQRRQVAQAAVEQAQKIDDLRKDIAAADELSPEAREELLRQLAELSDALRENPGDLEQALADLARLETALQAKLDPDADAQAANLRALASQLAALSGEQLSPEEQTLEAVLQALEAITAQTGSLSSMEQAELAQTLAELAANASQTGDLQLAQALSALSLAVSTGDQGAAGQAVSDSQVAIAQASQRLLDQQALQTAVNQLAASGQALAQAGNPLSGQPIAGRPGENPASSPGNSSGQASGQPAGQTTGGGTRADTLPPSQGSGKAGAPQGPADSPTTSNPDGQIYAPRLAGGGQGDPLFIPGSDTGQGDTQVSEGNTPLPGAANPSLVPYEQVYFDYLQAASQAMNQLVIPADLEAFVREYFSQLEPR
jgi:hypothetical protein